MGLIEVECDPSPVAADDFTVKSPRKPKQTRSQNEEREPAMSHNEERDMSQPKKSKTANYEPSKKWKKSMIQQ